MTRKHEKYERLIARCQVLTPAPTAVAHPCDESSLRGAVEAAELGILQPILVGPRARIEAVAAQFQLAISGYEIVDAPHSHAAADRAVQLAREGQAEMLTKGSLHTDELMGAVVRTGTGLRTERRISHALMRVRPEERVRDYAIVSIKVPEGVTVESLPWKRTSGGVIESYAGKTIKGPSSVTIMAVKAKMDATPNNTPADMWNTAGGWGGRSWQP